MSRNGMTSKYRNIQFKINKFKVRGRLKEDDKSLPFTAKKQRVARPTANTASCNVEESFSTKDKAEKLAKKTKTTSKKPPDFQKNSSTNNSKQNNSKSVVYVTKRNSIPSPPSSPFTPPEVSNKIIKPVFPPSPPDENLVACDNQNSLKEATKFEGGSNMDPIEKTLIVKRSPTHKCSYCMKTFFFPCHRRTHELIHTKEKPYKCTICKRMFSQLGSLNVHKRIHTKETPFPCLVCKRTFRHINSRNRHMYNIHQKEKPLQDHVQPDKKEQKLESMNKAEARSQQETTSQQENSLLDLRTAALPALPSLHYQPPFYYPNISLLNNGSFSFVANNRLFQPFYNRSPPFVVLFPPSLPYFPFTM